jgi:ABC-2 type transport system ATP-binding protein
MLVVSNISKKFGPKDALREVSFEIKKNEVVGLLGPNGAGKTTLMRILVGYLMPSEGEVEWNDGLIGYLPENNPLYGYLNVGEYLEYMAKIKGNNDPMEEIKRAADECGLRDVVGEKIDKLSKGFRQRVGLAAALLGDPRMLVLDEPTTGLDPNQIIEIRGLIKKLAKKKIVILSTHILPEAAAVCSRLLMINRGTIVLNDTTAKIKNLEKKFV